jgi:sulfoxide reductase catalytic subunit YedY
MGHKFTAKVPYQRITPPEIFFNRRKFLSAFGLGILAAPMATCSSAGAAQRPQDSLIDVPLQRPDVFPAMRNAAYEIPTAIERKDLVDREVAGSHNNFYEFLSGRGGPVWQFCGDFTVEPWSVEVSGECNNPMTLDLDDLFNFEHEERIYHFRCVERWAMNVPWSGFPLSKLIERADPNSQARYVKFTTAAVGDEMPGLKSSPWYPWPYQEALRLDEAMNELAMVVTGVYGEPLLRQHGSPVRIIVPWKYGYKNPKSIVKIEFVRNEPRTFWQVQPHEYGFLSNINPHIPHPRWAQNISFWLDTEEPFETPIFNGYEQFVANLYPDEPRTRQRPLRQGEIAR